MDKQYAERDIMALDKDGGHYTRHLSAMTDEALHDKSDIAAELAWRDAEIALLKRERDAYRTAEEHQIALRQKIEHERDALAALFVRLQDGATDLIHASSEEEAGDAMELIAECSEKEARNILARRDALKQAEALEGLITVCEKCPPGRNAGDVLRVAEQMLRAQREYLRRQTEAHQ